MFRCKFCPFHSPRLKEYLQHRPYHSILTNKYWCGFNGCFKSLHEEISLRSHLRRIHAFGVRRDLPQLISRPLVKLNQSAKLVCTVELCQKECDNRYTFIKHLKSHIQAHQFVECPFQGCEKKYDRLNSFTGHLAKKHKTISKLKDRHFLQETDTGHDFNDGSNLIERRIVRLEDDDGENIPDDGAPDINDTSIINVLTNPLQTESYRDPLLTKVAQLYLQLECKFLLPSDTIQKIVSESLGTHELTQEIVKNNLKSRLFEENLTLDKITAILDDVFEDDKFKKSLDTLKTTYRRRQFYKKEFAYVQPVEVVLKENEKKKSFFHYVPIEETLKQLFTDKSLATEFNGEPNVIDEDVLSDFPDGSVFRESAFFKENPDGLKLILYQDGFEVVNPIGSAVQKHKLLAIYMSIGNLNDHTRSHVNSIKLVALCKEKEFNHEKVYGRIVQDLQKIEQTGIELPSGKTLKGAVVFITGDNLGSHQLGGFVANFSTSTYFCRYCLITRNALQNEETLVTEFESRTVKSYKDALEKIGTADSYHGIKFDSIFNRLANFHVGTPGLPPCLGHDLLEGIVAYDVKLYLDQLSGLGWFSYEQLNQRIESFQYSSADRRDKPCNISRKKKRIVGGAWQIWIFLKLFPLLIKDEVQDASNDTWKCVLFLTEIVEIVCAPAIHICYLPYLASTISEYLSLRMKLPVKIRPKHHYLQHYPELIWKFGPLMKVWTMRFESKHAYFKRALRFSRNYINITKSMCEKHELFQSFLRSGADIRSAVETKGSTPLNIDIYNEAIQTAVGKIPNDNLQYCDEIVVKGTTYKIGNGLFIHQEGYQYGIEVGRISMLLCDEENVFVVCEVLRTVFLPHFRIFELGSCVRYECLPLNDSLPSREALHIYKVGDRLCVKPNYAPIRHTM